MITVYNSMECYEEARKRRARDIGKRRERMRNGTEFRDRVKSPTMENNIKIEKRGMKASLTPDYWVGRNGIANVQSNGDEGLQNASQ